MTPADKLWEDYCANPDRELLRVYADTLEQANDPRGAFINLSLLEAPTPEQTAKREAMLGKQKQKLAGPAGKFLREFYFGPDGLVSYARTEADKLVANPAVFRTLNPRLVLTITSIKTAKDAQAFAKVPLDGIFFVDFGWITGTHGGMNLSDKLLPLVGPALANVRHLQLSCRGLAEKCFTPAGLRALGPQLKALRYLAIDFYPDGMPPAADYARAVAETFPSTLRAFDMDGITELPGRADVEVATGLITGGRAQFGADFASRIAAILA